MFLYVFSRKRPTADLTIDRNFLRIRCPRCQWQPRKHDTWACRPGCGYWWNTFDTHGLCPGCEKRWRDTECLRCNIMSPHDEWYETERAS